MTAAQTLADFLLARAAEDEAVALSSPTHSWRSGDAPPSGHYAAATIRPRVMTEWVDNHSTVVVEVPSGGGGRPGVEEHIARHDPARVLAECEVRRQTVQMLTELSNQIRQADLIDPDYATALRVGRVIVEGICQLNALIYQDHPDYRDEWRP